LYECPANLGARGRHSGLPRHHVQRSVVATGNGSWS